VSYYPVFLDLRERPALVVGGGEVAHGKIVALLRAGARVTVVAPHLVESIERLVQDGKITLVTRPYAAEDVRGFHLVVATTGDAEIDRRVSSDAQRAGVLVNVVDQAALSSFIAPAVLERGNLQIAVSTSGSSPALAVSLRDRLEREVGPEYAVALAILREVRARLRAGEQTSDDRRRILRELADGRLVDRVRAKDRAGVDTLLASLAGQGMTLKALGIELD